MKWFFEGSFYVNSILALVALILVCTLKEKRVKALLAWAMFFYFLSPTVFWVRVFLTMRRIIEIGSVLAEGLIIGGGITNLAAHVLLLCFVIVAGSYASASVAGTAVQESGAEGVEIERPLFLYVPVGRLVLLAILSIGIYEIYWIYKNWRYLKERDGLNIQPFWRGFFGVFFIHKLFRAIHDDNQTNAVRQASFSPGGLATGWVILVILSNLVSRIPEPAVAFPFFLLSLLSFLFFIPVQSYINAVNQTLNRSLRFNPWSAGHIVCLIIGLVLWPLAIIGLTAG